MILNKKNASEFVGKKLYANNPRFHYYPLTVKKLESGEYAVVDKTKTMMIVGETPFNTYYFDRVEE